MSDVPQASSAVRNGKNSDFSKERSKSKHRNYFINYLGKTENDTKKSKTNPDHMKSAPSKTSKQTGNKSKTAIMEERSAHNRSKKDKVDEDALKSKQRDRSGSKLKKGHMELRSKHKTNRSSRSASKGKSNEKESSKSKKR